jgi:hypothetical protein
MHIQAQNALNFGDFHKYLASNIETLIIDLALN